MPLVVGIMETFVYTNIIHPLKPIVMRVLFVLLITLLFACENKTKSITNRQASILQEMEQVKNQYFKKIDSLDNIKKSDTSSAKQLEIANAFVSADAKKSMLLIQLQKEYDSLAVVLKNNKGE